MRVRFAGSGDAFGSGGRWQRCIHLSTEGQVRESALLLNIKRTDAHPADRPSRREPVVDCFPERREILRQFRYETYDREAYASAVVSPESADTPDATWPPPTRPTRNLIATTASQHPRPAR